MTHLNYVEKYEALLELEKGKAAKDVAAKFYIPQAPFQIQECTSDIDDPFSDLPLYIL